MNKITLVCITSYKNCLVNYASYYLDSLKFNHIIFIDSLNESLRNMFINFENITVLNFKDLNTDVNNYNSFNKLIVDVYNIIIDKFANEYDYLAFFDDDEYLEIKNKDLTSIHDYLNYFDFNNYSCIKVKWSVYKDDRIDGDPIFNTNFCRLIDSFETTDKIFKTIVNCKNKNNEIPYFYGDAHNNSTSHYCDSNCCDLHDPLLINCYNQTLVLNHFMYSPLIDYIKRRIVNRFECSNNDFGCTAKQIVNDWFNR